MREGNDLEDPGVDGWLILKWMFGKWDECMDFMDLARPRKDREVREG
jgi:hypothetical protein